MLSQEEKSPRWGPLSPLDVEIFDPVGDWYYFGRVEMLTKKLSNGKDTLHIYRLLTKFREDEKVIISTQDFIQIADQIPYTQTKKGKDRLFQLFMLTFVAIYGLTLWFMSLLIQAGPSIIYYTSQVRGLEFDVATVAVMFVSIAGSWAWAARYHHYVSDWEIQPLTVNSLKSNTDFYILTNSSKVPIFQETKELVKFAEAEITPEDKAKATTFINDVRLFQKEEIDRLQESVEYYNDQLQDLHVDAFSAKQTSLNASLMTRNQRIFERRNSAKYYFYLALTFAVGVIVTVVAMSVVG
jgi:hypothetical protein